MKSEPNEREAFDKEMQKKYGWNSSKHILDNKELYTEFVYACVYYSWQAWQAAWQHRQSRIDELEADFLKLQRDCIKVSIDYVALQAQLTVAVDALGEINTGDNIIINLPQPNMEVANDYPKFTTKNKQIATEALNTINKMKAGE
jgi:hypothetical protein